MPGESSEGKPDTEITLVRVLEASTFSKVLATHVPGGVASSRIAPGFALGGGHHFHAL